MLRIRFKRELILLLISTLLFCPVLMVDAMAGSTEKWQCQPTEEDEMGPFYRPGATVRSTIGSGYLLNGTVRSAEDCQPLSSVRIEFWQAGPDGKYEDKYRAAIITDRQGHYQLETDAPAPYVTRPPHIHIRISADGYQTLVTQHYLQKGVTQASFDLVLTQIMPKTHLVD